MQVSTEIGLMSSACNS